MSLLCKRPDQISTPKDIARQETNNLMNVRFILVEPKVPENIGASARAIKTMGFRELILVNPVEWREGKSKWVAHGSEDILDEAVVFSSLAEALKGSDFNIATSAKQRTVMEDVVPADRLYEFLNERAPLLPGISLVFGREESGLTNEEIRLCDIVTSVPMIAKFPSLNLSQAVMIYAWELSGLGRTAESDCRNEPGESLKILKQKSELILDMIGIGREDNRYGRIMERLSFVSGTDLNLFHSVINLLLEKPVNGQS
jgi:tRNA/rRNA methyltransferase